VIAILASLGLIFSMIYSLRLIQETIQGPTKRAWKIADLGRREIFVLALLAFLTIGLGLMPSVITSRLPILNYWYFQLPNSSNHIVYNAVDSIRSEDIP